MLLLLILVLFDILVVSLVFVLRINVWLTLWRSILLPLGFLPVRERASSVKFFVVEVM